MRPARFADFVIDVVKNQPTASRVQTLAEVGDVKHPFGVAITTAVGETRWQFIGQLPDGAKHETFTDTPVVGDPAPVGTAPQPNDVPEAWLAAAVTHAENPEIANIERWSVREGERAGNYGVTVRFHDGSKVFARQL